MKSAFKSSSFVLILLSRLVKSNALINLRCPKKTNEITNHHQRLDVCDYHRVKKEQMQQLEAILKKAF